MDPGFRRDDDEADETAFNEIVDVKQYREAPLVLCASVPLS